MKTEILLSEYIKNIINEILLEGSEKAPPIPQNVATDSLVKGAQAILNSNKDKLAKKGINIDSLKQINSGTMGSVYDMGNGRILKITKDIREAKASNIVLGKNIPNIVKVFDLWGFQGGVWYGIILEKLTPLSKEEENQLTQSIIDTKFTVLLHQAGDDWNKAMQMLAQQTMNTLVQQAYKQFPDAQQGAGVRDPRVQQVVKSGVDKVILDFNRITKEYNMKDLFKSLKTLGVQYYDFHGGNYGRRADGTLVLFDLGRSISNGAKPTELTENFWLVDTIKII